MHPVSPYFFLYVQVKKPYNTSRIYTNTVLDKNSDRYETCVYAIKS